jgi:hypothetical protein
MFCPKRNRIMNYVSRNGRPAYSPTSRFFPLTDGAGLSREVSHATIRVPHLRREAAKVGNFRDSENPNFLDTQVCGAIPQTRREADLPSAQPARRSSDADA